MIEVRPFSYRPIDPWAEVDLAWELFGYPDAHRLDRLVYLIDRRRGRCPV